MQHSPTEVRRAFGLLFIGIAIAVGVAAVLSEIAFVYNGAFYYAIIWVTSFGIVFGATLGKFRNVIPAIRGRMKNSIKWSSTAKTLNGLCWAGPFIAIAVFQSLFQYLILLGIGAGSLSTYVLMKKYSGLDNPEQLIVGLISLAAIPIAIEIDTTVFTSSQDIAVMLSRILISIAYAAGGVYALLARETQVS